MSTSFKTIPGGVCTPQGFKASALATGIKNPESEKLDLALIYSPSTCSSAAVFTKNQVKAAPLRFNIENLQNYNIQAILANSGNANACTGKIGMEDAQLCAEHLATLLQIEPEQVSLSSTGVIGIPLPMQRITPKIPLLVENLSKENDTKVAQAIMTSDTTHKEIAVSFKVGEKEVTLGACAKGAGMICPSMATMLCFITTDACISKELLQTALNSCVKTSFNRITIDGDMSTNDSVILLANGQSGIAEIKAEDNSFQLFQQALQYVMLEMAKALVRDGERVTKFITLNVKGANDHQDAQKVAEAIANSALVKSSWNGNDPNWGRIIHAVGYSKALIKEELINIKIAGKEACCGGIATNTPMPDLREAVQDSQFEIEVDLQIGSGEYTIYTSDISPEYINFNRSEYAYWKQARKDGVI